MIYKSSSSAKPTSSFQFSELYDQPAFEWRLRSTVKTEETHGSVQTFQLRANIEVRHVFGPPAGGRRPEAQEHEATGSGPGMLCLRAADHDAAETIPAS